MWRFGGGEYDDEVYSSGIPAIPGAFTRQFRCYPVSFIDRSELENGDKIVLPPSALHSLTRLNIQYPMYFQLESRHGRKTHVGVLEFVAEEGHCYMPYWLMQHLIVSEGEMITIRNALLEKGRFVKFQPQSSDFLAISNPKAVLEATLRSFTCLTKGDSIAINYNSKIYWLDVLSVAPGDAVSIIEADVNVEFAPPKDYVEPEKKPEKAKRDSSSPTGLAFGGDGGTGSRLAERLERLKSVKKGEDGESSEDSSDEDEKPSVKPRFPGVGQVLKPRAGHGQGLMVGGASALAAGVNGSPSGDQSGGIQKKKQDQKHPPSFEPFSGQGRTLKD